MFRNVFNQISSNNLVIIIELNVLRALQVLQLLFFSTYDNIESEYLNIKLLEIKSAFKKCSTIHMRKLIELILHDQTHNYQTHQNEFLIKMNDKEYCEIFKMLNTYLNTLCLT